MNLSVCSLASGSSGNCYVISGGHSLLLVDAGISGKQIKLRLKEKGYDGESLDAILITHEHQDHVKGLKTMQKLGIPVYGTKGSLDNLGFPLPEYQMKIINSSESFKIGDICIECFPLSHDAADPVGYCFEHKGSRAAIVTDTGILTDNAKKCMAESDIIVLEANHDVSMLKIGPYPWFLKQRILGEKGHMSNEAAAEGLAEIMADGKRRLILLAHLSKENNFPEMALATVENILEERGIRLCDIRLETLSRTLPGEIYSI